MSETLVERLAARWAPRVSEDAAELAQSDARWWLRAIADELQGEALREPRGTAMEPFVAVKKWLRTEADK